MKGTSLFRARHKIWILAVVNANAAFCFKRKDQLLGMHANMMVMPFTANWSSDKKECVAIANSLQRHGILGNKSHFDIRYHQYKPTQTIYEKNCNITHFHKSHMTFPNWRTCVAAPGMFLSNSCVGFLSQLQPILKFKSYPYASTNAINPHKYSLFP